ncbi:MAG TPA: hypothetical protein VMW79_07825 [Anaerolineae bacterium]|nr:hypothetical protein [Anaerolineae bacterium]
MDDRERYIEEEQAWLSKYGDTYREAIQNMSDPTYVRGLLRGIADKLGNALAYNPREDEPHVAAFILGALQAKLEKVLTDIEFVDKYEERRDDLNATFQPLDDGSHGGPPESMDEL